MAEVAKLDVIDTAEKTMVALRERVDKAMLAETMRPINYIDRGEVNDGVLEYGKWPAESGVEELGDHIIDAIDRGKLDSHILPYGNWPGESGVEEIDGHVIMKFPPGYRWD